MNANDTFLSASGSSPSADGSTSLVTPRSTTSRDDTGIYHRSRRLSTAEYQNLAESIKEHGVLVPILVDAQGNVIDGHHRKTIADKLDIECPKIAIADGFLPDEIDVVSKTINRARRHPTSTELTRVILTYFEGASPNKLPDTEIAKREGVSTSFVQKVRAEHGFAAAGRGGKLKPEIREQVEARIKSDPSIGTRKLATDFGISTNTAKAIKDDVVSVTTPEVTDTTRQDEITHLASIPVAASESEKSDLHRILEQGALMQSRAETFTRSHLDHTVQIAAAEVDRLDTQIATLQALRGRLTAA